MTESVESPSDAVAASAPAAASEVVAACEAGWSAIQRHHAEIPDVVVVLGSGVERGRLVKLGHWWGGRWIADGDLRGEVLLAGEALHLSPEAVFEVLLHEAAHGLNAARGVKDSSRGGRYHNARFKVVAEELGLVVASMPPYGWAQTSIGPEARQRYDTEIASLGDAMRIARRVAIDLRVAGGSIESETADRDRDRDRDDDRKKRDAQRAAECDCGRKMRMAPSTLARGPVVCGLCGHEFAIGRSTENAQPPPTADRQLGDEQRTADVPLRARSNRGSRSELALEELTPVQRDGLATLLDIGARTEGARLLAEIGGWYGAERGGGQHPLLGKDQPEVDAANRAARAMRKLDETLTGPSVVVAGRELMRGDVVLIADTATEPKDVKGVDLPPPGVLGHVELVNEDDRTLVVDFPIAGRHVISIDSPAATVLLHAYAERVDTAGAPLVDLRTLPTHLEPEMNQSTIELVR